MLMSLLTCEISVELVNYSDRFSDPQLQIVSFTVLLIDFFCSNSDMYSFIVCNVKAPISIKIPAQISSLWDNKDNKLLCL